MFVCAGNGEDFEFANSIGVGIVESAINLSRICEQQKPKYLIFVGSAGSYDMNMPLLELCISEEAVQIESSFLFDKSYTPISLYTKSPQNVSCETFHNIKSLDLKSVSVNSSNYITIDSNIAKTFKDKGIVLENMEFFSVLSVGKKFDIPALGIFCVSNYCHSQAHEEFIKNQAAVMQKLSDVVEKILGFC